MAEKASDPYSVLLRSNKLPMTLIRDGSDVPGLKQHQAKMTIETSSFADTFGPKSQRKRVKLGVSSLADLAEGTESSMDTYKDRLEQARLLSGAGEREEGGEDRVDVADPLSMAIEPVFNKGQSKRIWNELYKVGRHMPLNDGIDLSRLTSIGSRFIGCGPSRSRYVIQIIVLRFLLLDNC